jgi:hypothetical protein
VLIASLLALVAGEALVRLLGRTDADGNFWLGGKIRGPRHPELTRLTILIEEYEARPDEVMYAYDAELGWIWRPGATSKDGRYHIDERGIRTGAGSTPRRDGPIVALYGGSVTFCAEVLHEECWGYQLERLLAEAGRGHQILNLGVGGYDMGQSYLRWRSTHSELRPEVVVFGLSPTNIIGNASVIRAFHYPTTNLPFSKPRFVLEGGELGVVNVPPLPPRDALEVLRDPRGWELLPWELYVEGERETKFWQHSRLLCRLFCSRSSLGKYKREDSRAFQLAIRIIQRFHDEVQAAGARFVIVNLPDPDELGQARDGEPAPHVSALLAELERRGMAVVDPTPELLEQAERESFAELFAPQEHFSPSGNRVIAEVLARNF